MKIRLEGAELFKCGQTDMMKLIVKLSQFLGKLKKKKKVAEKIELRRICMMDLPCPIGPSTYLLNSLRIRKSIWTIFLHSFVWICQTLHVSRFLVHPVPLISYNLQNPRLIACSTVTFTRMLSQFRFL
jgi:hypothetical protein